MVDMVNDLGSRRLTLSDRRSDLRLLRSSLEHPERFPQFPAQDWLNGEPIVLMC